MDGDFQDPQTSNLPMARTTLLCLALVLGFSFSAPRPQNIQLPCDTCSPQVTIPSGTVDIWEVFDTEADARLHAESDNWSGKQLVGTLYASVFHIVCRKCPPPNSTQSCNRYEDTDYDPGDVTVFWRPTGEGTWEVGVEFLQDVKVWICCGPC